VFEKKEENCCIFRTLFSLITSPSYLWFKWKIDHAPNELGNNLLPGSYVCNHC